MTVTVSASLKRSLKSEAKKRGMKLYALVEQLLKSALAAEAR